MYWFLKKRYIKVNQLSWDKLRNKTIIYINPINFEMLRVTKFPENVFYRVDGIFTTWIFRTIFRIKNVSPESFDYSSVAGYIFQMIVDNNLRLNIVGGTVEDNKEFVKDLRSRCPKIQILASRHGFDSENEIIEYIKANPADVTLLGLGSPKQERIAIELSRLGSGGTILCCGGFISQTASAQGNFYPPQVVRWNIRWIYRIYKKPIHILRFFKYPLFFLKCIRFRLSHN